MRNGVYADLTDALPQCAPKYYAQLNPSVWLAPKVGGKIYAGVNEQILPGAIGPICQTDMVEKYGLDLAKVTKPEDMEEWQDKIVAGEGGKRDPLLGRVQYLVDALYGVDDPGYGLVDYNDADLKVVPCWDHPQWQARHEPDQKVVR